MVTFPMRTGRDDHKSGCFLPGEALVSLWEPRCSCWLRGDIGIQGHPHLVLITPCSKINLLLKFLLP